MSKPGNKYRVLGAIIAAAGIIGSVIWAGHPTISSGYYAGVFELIFGVIMSLLQCVAWWAVGSVIDYLSKCSELLTSIDHHVWNLDKPNHGSDVSES